jgi:hypothetical protein
MALVDKDGNPIEGTLTAEEAEQFVNAATEKSKTEYEAKLAELNKKLEDNSNAALRKKSEKTEKEKEELGKQVSDLKNNIAKTLREAALAPLAKNEDTKKKILEAYDRLRPADESDAEAVAAAMKDAYKLSSDDIGTGALHASFGGVGGAVPKDVAKDDAVFSPELKAMGSKFGLTEEDYKRYGKNVPSQYR